LAFCSGNEEQPAIINPTSSDITFFILILRFMIDFHIQPNAALCGNLGATASKFSVAAPC
jgi:hypothetical protein